MEFLQIKNKFLKKIRVAANKNRVAANKDQVAAKKRKTTHDTFFSHRLCRWFFLESVTKCKVKINEKE